MAKVAFIDLTTGGIQSVRTVGNDTQYVDGEVYGGAMAMQIPSDSDDSFIVNKYWSGGQFYDKPKKPSKFHIWSISGWQLNNDKMFESIRLVRSELLSASDWTQMPDAPLTEQQRTAWAIYRQSLRDVPQNNLNAESIDDIIWPTKPE